MNYTPTNWQTGDTVTAEKLNNIENGIVALASMPNLPIISNSDNGKILRVVNGSWSAAQLSNASGVNF